MIVQLPGIQPEIAIPAVPDDERVWVPQAPLVWFRPLLLNTVTGSWCNLLRVRKSGVLSRHIHPSWVTGYVIKGAWRYLEHDWVAHEGSFVYEPPGEIHTLVVDEQVGATEMITLFNIHGAMVYVDADGRQTGYEDVFSKIAMCRAHYEANEYEKALALEPQHLGANEYLGELYLEQKDLANAEKKSIEELRAARESAAELRAGAEKQAAKLIEDARAEANRVIAAAREAATAEAGAAAQKAKDALRDQVAALAVAGAERILRREINAQVHSDLLSNLKQELS